MKESELLKNIRAYKKEIQQALTVSKKRLENSKKDGTEGTLKYSKSKSGKYYYSLFITESDGARKSRYLKRIDRSVASCIAQRDYDCKFIRKAGRLLGLLGSLESEIEEGGIDSVFEKTIDARRCLIIPAGKSLDMLVSEWENSVYERKSFPDDYPVFMTEKGERVRSKSEIIIANSLRKHGIPYRYECPLSVDGHIIHPDFTVLNPETGKIYYWEHLGMLDDNQYRHDALKRIAAYEADGLFSGTEVIYTLESYASPLTPSAVERKIRKILM